VLYGVRFTYGVYFTPLANDLKLDSATTAAAYSISMLLEGVFSLVMGLLADKYGPRKILTISAILASLGYFLMPLCHHAWQLFLIYGVLIGVGMGGIFVPVISTIVRWFARRRSLMTGVVGSGVGLGLLVFSPVSSALIARVGWGETFFIMGFLTLIVGVVAAQFFRRDPLSSGLTPDGQSEDWLRPAHLENTREFSFREALGTRQYWSIFVMILAFGFFSASVSVHLVPEVEHQGIASGTAANILAASGFFLVAGRIIQGALADRIGNKSIFVLGFTISTLALVWIFFLKTEYAYFVFAAAIGFCQGGIGVGQSPLLASLFGLGALGTIFGLTGFGFTVGAAVGPFVTGKIYDATFSYQTAFIISTVLSFLGLLLAISINPIKKRAKTADQTKRLRA
jgi:OFA family oxalate/formate antiporter-like MFS transporter